MSRRVSDKEIAKALVASLGVQSKAAFKLGISRATVNRAIHRSKIVKEALEEGCSKGLDLAESKLYDAILDGAPWAIKTILTLRGWSRGYRETQDVTVTPNPAPAVADIPTEALERIIGERRAQKDADGGKG